jgi:drug/metabolite transporter (DMT)-like permease
MLYLICCILSSTGIFLVFRFIDRQRVPAFPVIVINYLTATVLGFALNSWNPGLGGILSKEWLPSSIIIGILFIVMFFLVARSTSKAGISVTTVASKMSVVIPILFSLAIDFSDRITPLKVVAFACTLAGVGLTVFKPREERFDRSVMYIPLILFFGMGLVDSLVKHAQHYHVNDTDTVLFSAVLFMNAFVPGLLVLLFRRRYLTWFRKPVTWAWGMLLGIVNFGSIFFLVNALNYHSPTGKGLDSSVVFGVNNTGIVALSVLAGLVIFRERLQAINWVGVALSAVALILFSLCG